MAVADWLPSIPPIKPAIGDMKNDGGIRRNWLKGRDGDAFHALLCSCGHNLRKILRKLLPLFGLRATGPLLAQLIQMVQYRLPGDDGLGSTPRLLSLALTS